MVAWFYFFLAAVSFLILAIAGVEFLNALNRLRGPRIVTCPADGRSVGIEVDAMHAAASAVRGHGVDCRVVKCTSWPERERCGQECLRQVKVQPEATLLKSHLASWYAAHECALCGRAIRVIPPEGRGPGFLNERREKIAWRQLPLEGFPESLQHHAPLCTSCRASGTA